MKRTIEFLDASRHSVELEIRTTDGYFSMSGECNGSMGQCYDEIEPKNEQQKQLIDIWKKWQIKSDYPNELIEQVNSLCDEIEEIEEEEKERKITEDDIELFEKFDEPEKALALALMFGLCVNEIDDIENTDGNYWSVQGTDYLFGTDEEMDDEWEKELDNYIEECVLPEIPEHYRNYFDDESFKTDCRYDGRARSLNKYNGGEEEINVNGICYYAYRQ